MRYKKIYNLIVFEDGTIYRELKTKCKLSGLTKTPKGYLTVKVNNENVLVHRLVMEVFKGKSDLTVDHIDGNKENNSLDNLEYVTITENVLRYFNKHHDIKPNINYEGYKKGKRIEWNGKIYKSATELSVKLGFSASYVSQKIKRSKPIKGSLAKFI